ncbi:MAG: hypothetical protein WBB28_28945 [Crinalium sp.]
MRVIIFPKRSILITTAIGSLLILDLTKPGYRSFALVPELKPQVLDVVTDFSKTATKFSSYATNSLIATPNSNSVPKAKSQIKSQIKELKPCATLLEGYKKNSKGEPVCRGIAQSTY